MPFEVFRDLCRSNFSKAVDAGAAVNDPAITMLIFDKGIHTIYRTLTEGEYKTIDVTDEVREFMGPHFQTLVDIGVHRMEMISISVDGESVFEAGGFVNTEGKHVGGEELMNQSPAVLEALCRATIRMMHRNGMGEKLEALKNGGVHGVLADIFSEMLDEVIAEEIEEKVAEFGKQLESMLSVEPLIKPWSPPRGEVKNDGLPPPG